VLARRLQGRDAIECLLDVTGLPEPGCHDHRLVIDRYAPDPLYGRSEEHDRTHALERSLTVAGRAGAVAATVRAKWAWRRQLRAQRERDAVARSFYAQFVSPGDLVFDVGANDGDRTRVFRSLGARVVSAEPQPACVERLQSTFGDDPEVAIVGKALAASEGTAELMQNEAAVLSSMSPDFIAATEQSGRFAQWSKWSGSITVETTTLDKLIEQHGVPRFCKVDVEGFELEVLRGLSRAVPVLSIEYTAETYEKSVAAVEHLSSLGLSRFAFAAAETFRFWPQGWASADEVTAGLRALPDPRAWGDIYAAS
jgi:FkbM family methyltransferase